jgi:formate--tetrahydrofolate ligase
MAILCLASDIDDLKRRLGAIVVGYRRDGSAVRASDLQAVGAMAVLLRDALKPNLVQTTEGVPALVHGGPFANIAHGTSSITATRLALAYADAVVTEAGFAFELGAEKFFDINCRYGGFAPVCTVLVATLRALKVHGGVPLSEVARPDPEAVARGLANLEKHVENIRKFEQKCVVAINHFPADTEPEIAVVREHAEILGLAAVVARPFSEGGEGCRELAETVWAVASRGRAHFKPLYEWSDPIEQKILTVASEMYGAEAVDYQLRARRDKAQLEQLGYGGLPVCIAKTQSSLSDNPSLLGRPKDFLVTVREIQLAAGAGYIVPITGEILRMPGLPREPLAERFDLSSEGAIVFNAAAPPPAPEAAPRSAPAAPTRAAASSAE